eukprot:CAMPEP_0169368050 /NCGR_PEP_ID=MMETSP1017-20121227/34020_1 /TAXON_ID=342587 /ORGANISM="Karlodinium micrum, Strain CCMP2283" /LENGTH=47 /DNA_ID= /DNA_START= /DNA_END= /DNA_ORIENTATION=
MTFFHDVVDTIPMPSSLSNASRARNVGATSSGGNACNTMFKKTTSNL